jgi:hypothetical protein
MLWVIDKLRQETGLQLITTPEVRKEVVDKALKIEKFRLGGIRVLKRFGSGAITVENTNPSLSKKILDTANKVYSVNGNDYKIVQKGEMSLVPIAQSKGSNYMLVDERIVEKLLSDPMALGRLFESRLHMKVVINKNKLEEFKLLTKGINVIKSSDLIAIAHEKGLLKGYVKESFSKKTMKDFVSGALWGLKKSGCSISTLDIKEYMKVLF